MKILVIGATGSAGSRIVTEALQRGHEVTAASRHRTDPSAGLPDVQVLSLNAADPQQVAQAARTHDVVVGATRPAAGREGDVIETTAGLAEGTRRADRRLVVVGGASPLIVPGTGRRALDDPNWVPATIREIATASCRQLETLQQAAGLDWTYLAPAAIFQPGPRIGEYRSGGDQLVIDGSGRSTISMEDYAIAMLDEIETPTTRCAVLSTGY
jgi:putative NADH-flavin reductase